MSAPAPPVSVSSPMPPEIESSPEPPYIVSVAFAACYTKVVVCAAIQLVIARLTRYPVVACAAHISYRGRFRRHYRYQPDILSLPAPPYNGRRRRSPPLIESSPSPPYNLIVARRQPVDEIVAVAAVERISRPSR